jgi:pyruvate dehydrogenase E2 component (dihydrolipoamide acetyltransferase)
MTIEITLPRFGRTMEQATVLAVHVRPGDKVKKGQILADLETDKAAMEMESPAEGFIGSVLAEPGMTLPVDTPMFVLTEDKRPIDPALLDKLRHQVQTARQTILEAKPADVQPIDLSAPADLSADLLSKIRPVTGPIEAIRAFDTSRQPAAAQLKPGSRIPLGRWQRIIADKMLASKRQIPCFYLNLRADVTDLIALRQQNNHRDNLNLSYNDFLLKAMAVSLVRYPILTGRLAAEFIELPDQIDIGIAIAAEHGLVAPVLRAVDKMTLPQITAAVADLFQRARQNALRPEDLEGGCITLSNLGGCGIDSFIPIVIPGQTSILGVGRISEQCVPDNDQVRIRKFMTLTLSVDHRLVNGADAAQFLDYIKKQLEHPESLMEDV